MRSLIVLGLLLTACANDSSTASDLAVPPDLRTAACLTNNDCPSGQYCLPPCSCFFGGDGGHFCDVFVAMCVPTIQGLPCHVEGDHVVCRQ